MATKARLHELVDMLPASTMATANDCLENLISGDPVLHALEHAPFDDEPDDDDWDGGLAESRAEADRGDTLSHDEVRQRLGLA